MRRVTLVVLVVLVLLVVGAVAVIAGDMGSPNKVTHLTGDGWEFEVPS